MWSEPVWALGLGTLICCSLLELVVSGCKLWTEGWKSEGGVTPAWAGGIWGGSSATCEGLQLSPVTERIAVTKLCWWLEHVKSVLSEPALVSGRRFSHFWGGVELHVACLCVLASPTYGFCGKNHRGFPTLPFTSVYAAAANSAEGAAWADLSFAS